MLFDLIARITLDESENANKSPEQLSCCDRWPPPCNQKLVYISVTTCASFFHVNLVAKVTILEYLK